MTLKDMLCSFGFTNLKDFLCTTINLPTRFNICTEKFTEDKPLLLKQDADIIINDIQENIKVDDTECTNESSDTVVKEINDKVYDDKEIIIDEEISNVC